MTITTRVTIARDSGVPLYRQLRQALEHEIATGALDADLPLPSSRELARELGLSRNTVNTAYAELEAEGFVDAEACRGLFVNKEMLQEAARSPGTTVPRSVDWSHHLTERLDADMPEIAKFRDWHLQPFPFVGGQIDPASFPRLAWSRALREALEPPNLHYSLRDGIDEDDPELLDRLCRNVLPGRGIEADPSQVLVTLGSQQGLDLLSHALLRPGSVVAVEDPGYPDTRHIFTRAGAALRYLPVDGSGVLPPPDLAGVSLLALTPSHHCPTNVTLSVVRRRVLLAMAQEHDSLIVEDDYDSEFRYQGSPSPAMKAMAHSERVIYLGTFSKFLAPGLRLGYLVAAPELIAELRNQRRYRVRHPSGHTQRATALLIASGQYHRTVRRRRTQLSRSWNTLRRALDTHLAWPQEPPPPGGTSIWVTAPEGFDCVRLAGAALERGVVVERGDIYFAHPDANRHHLRLGFAALPEDQIDPGVAILGELAAAQLRS